MSTSSIRDKLKGLMRQKEEIEAELEAVASTSNSGEKLVDEQGFPRADIDVYSVRESRHRQAELINDHKQLMKQIEELMLKLHGEERAKKQQQQQQQQSNPSI